MEKELMIQILLNAWESGIKQTTDFFNNISEEQMYQEIAPGKNRVIYLLGHMVAVHDDMLPLLGFGERRYEQLREPFLEKADKEVPALPNADDLKEAWEETNRVLSEKFAQLSPEEWLQKHTRISDEDFARQPHRNRLSVLVNRTTHLSYHLGQLVLVKNK